MIPDGVKIIETGTFVDCNSLSKAEIPESVKIIEANAFLYTELRDVYYTGSEEQWKLIDIEEDNEKLLFATIHTKSHMPDENYDSFESYGDVNFDEKVTAKDAMMAQRIAINLDSPNVDQFKAADVDKDGTVTTKDALYILRCSLKLTVLPVVR